MRYIIDSDIIDLDDVRNSMETMKRNEILKKHPYSIWNGANGKWYTYFPDEKKDQGRSLKKRNTQKDIEDLVIEYWRTRTEKEKIYSFYDVYLMWRNVQDQLVSENSVAKYDTDCRRFLKDADAAEFAGKNIKNITDDDIRLYLVKTIKRCKLGKEPTRKLLGYVRNTIVYARKHGLIDGNPVEFIESKDFYRYCTEEYKPADKRIISRDDMKALQSQFKRDHEKMPNYIPTYAVEFASLTGMRVSEIAALSWDCITDECIVVKSSEKANRTKTQFHIDKTKNGKIRFFPMTDEIRELLRKVKVVEAENGYLCEWVFANENGRIHAPIISSCSKAKCRQLGIDEKGIHAFRKTLNSKMRCDGVSATVAASILGHTKEVNEQYYTFDVTDIAEKAQIVSKINRETQVI